MIRPGKSPVMCLAFLVAALTLIIWFEFNAGLGAPTAGVGPVRTESPDPVSSKPLSNPDPSRMALLSAMLLTRPLFSPTRLPPDDTDPRSRDQAPTLPRLAGVIVTSAGRRAIFAAPGGKSVVLKEGDRLNAFVVQTIWPRQVILRDPDGIHQLSPAFEREGSPAEPPSVALPGFPLRRGVAGVGDP